MSGPWILESKLEAPAPPAFLLRRALVPADEPLPPATLLVAGPGYGKTLALRELAAHPGEAVALWYGLDELDADPATFFHYLVAGMRREVPGFGEDLLALLAGPPGDPRRLWDAYFRGVAAYGLPGLRLVLDDVHHLTGAGDALLRGLLWFAGRLPAGVHVLMGARRRPAATARLELGGQLRVFDEARLRLTAAEELAVLRGRAGGEPPDAWRRQALALDGWPLGVARIGLPGGEAATLELLAREIFEAAAPEARRLLAQAALLPEVTAEAVAAVFGWPDAANALAALADDQLLARVGGGRFRVPAHLAAFLAGEARDAFGPAAVEGWHRRAATHFLTGGRAELALPHHAAAGDWEAAIATSAACFPAMRFGGRRAQIERWLAAFPPAWREGHPHLRLWRGHLASAAGDLAAARGCYEAAQRGFDERDDAAGGFKVLVRRCGLAFVMEDAREANRLLLQAAARAADGLPEDLADLALARALAADLRGDVAVMRECNEDALAVPVAGNVEVAATHCNAHINLYTLGLLHGDLRAAERHIAEAGALAEAWGFHAYAQAAAFLAADVRLTEGDLAGAEALVARVPAVWPEVLDWHGRACAQVVTGQLAQARGDHAKAEAAYRQAIATFEAAGFREGVKVPLERLAWLALHRRAPARVEALLAEAGPPDDASVYDLALRVPQGRALHLLGRPAEAIEVLARAAADLSALGATLHATRARLYLAAAQAAAGDPAAAATRAAAEAAIEAHDHAFLRQQDLQLWQELGAIAAPAPPTASPPPAAPAAPGRGLELRFLGPFEVRVDGVRVDQWPRKKARLVLAALALHPHGLTTHELLDAVGEPAISQTTANAWQVVLVALRRVLEPALAKRGASRFVTHVGDRYGLAWDQVTLLDRTDFLAAMQDGDRARDAAPAEAARAYARAMDLYRGHLLEDVDLAAAFDADREYLKQAALRALAWLAEHHQNRAEEAEAERWVRRAVALAPEEEAGYHALMRYAVRWGRPDVVREAYWECRKALKARLGLAPSEELERAYRELGGSTAAPARALTRP